LRLRIDNANHHRQKRNLFFHGIWILVLEIVDLCLTKSLPFG
jgi:hypothetical protein